MLQRQLSESENYHIQMAFIYANLAKAPVSLQSCLNLQTNSFQNIDRQTAKDRVKMLFSPRRKRRGKVGKGGG